MAIQSIVGPCALLGTRLGLILLLLLCGPAQADLLVAKAIDLRTLPSLGQILPSLMDKRVIFVGEAHDQYSHHLVQLAVIRALHERHPDLVIGMEQFQQPFQHHLDAWVAGEIDEETLLRRTEYLERWRFDYRLYRPILQYARDHKVPIIALNVPGELTARVAAGGLAALNEEEKKSFPEIDRGNDNYRERIKAVFDAHPPREGRRFDHFLDAQLLWDEGMAARAADYLKANPKRSMVILAGEGHVAWRDGIPNRLARRVTASSAVVLNGAHEALTPELADFVVLPGSEKLPPRGLLGLLMGADEGGVRVTGFAEESAAQAAGVEKDDHIVEIDGRKMATPADVTLTMMDRKPGESVDLAVARRAWTGSDRLLRYRVQLR